jgi:hypothetical protein
LSFQLKKKGTSRPEKKKKESHECSNKETRKK